MRADYRHQISVPAGRPTDAATTARESIANAAAVAQQLSGPLADELLTSARQAFTSGLSAVAASDPDHLRIEFRIRCGGARSVGT